jgi:hypothetical protein
MEVGRENTWERLVALPNRRWAAVQALSAAVLQIPIISLLAYIVLADGHGKVDEILDHQPVDHCRLIQHPWAKTVEILIPRGGSGHGACQVYGHHI